MSLKSKGTTRPGVYIPSTSFSSMSTGSFTTHRISNAMNQAPSITAVTINKSLLIPMNIEIDPMIQEVRTQEKEQIKCLNNQFASYIEKVRHLEQQNKMLETKWKLLEGNTPGHSDIEPLLKDYIASLEMQLEFLNKDKQRLDIENEVMHKNVIDYKTRYEDEIEKRNRAENEFVLLKKDVDAGYLSKIELQDKVRSLTEEFNFLKAVYDTEYRELLENMKETSVVVQMDNSRGINMEQIISDVKAQYEYIAAHSREEAENRYKTKFDKMSTEADRYGNELSSTKSEIAELTRLINRRENEIETIKAQRVNLEDRIAKEEEDGDSAIANANTSIRALEMALQRNKQDLARQLREYQELMNVKLALDIEISTYRKLLEGEEDRHGQETVYNIKTVPTRNYSQQKLERQKSVPIVIKTMETNDVTYN